MDDLKFNKLAAAFLLAVLLAMVNVVHLPDEFVPSVRNSKRGNCSKCRNGRVRMDNCHACVV